MNPLRVLALTGGVGGAKLGLGLYRVLETGAVGFIVNTGDDFQHLGLHISPDIDTLLYTLAGCNNEALGWGRRDETWQCMTLLERLGGPTWFRLGDGDLALHLERTRRLAAGETLTAITAQLASALGIEAAVLPMSDSAVATRVHTADGPLDFQDYFVARRAMPVVTSIEFCGAATATLSSAVASAFAAPRLECVVLCPSNPYLSVDPLLAIPGLRQQLTAARVPVVAVCPVVGGSAIKGPTTKIMAELGLSPNPATIARHYAGLIDGLVIDAADAAWAGRCGVPTCVTQTVMHSLQDREQLAQTTLAFAATL